MTWENLLRPPLREIGAYEPGEPLDELMARHGLSTVDKLNWNEGLWGPLPGVLDATAGALDQTWAYPEHAFNTLREAIAADTGAQPGQVLPGHGIQALILTLVNAFVSPGDTVVVPAPTYGLYAQACRVAGARVERVGSPELRLDLEAIAAAVRDDRREARVDLRPEQPDGPAARRRRVAGVPGRRRPGLRRGRRRGLHGLRRAGRARAARGRRRRRAPRRRPAHVLEDLRPRRAAAGLPARRPGPRALPQQRAGAVQRQPRGARRRASRASAASARSPSAATSRPARASASAGALVAGGMAPVPSSANFVLVELGGADDIELAEALVRRGVLIRPGSELGLPGWARITVAPDDVMDRAAAALLETRDELLGAGAGVAS